MQVVFVVLQHCNEEECWEMLRRWNIKMPPAGSAHYWMGNKSITRKAPSTQMINVSLDAFENRFAGLVCATCGNKHTNIRTSAYKIHSTYEQMSSVSYSYSSIQSHGLCLCTQIHIYIKASHNNMRQDSLLAWKTGFLHKLLSYHDFVCQCFLPITGKTFKLNFVFLPPLWDNKTA